MDIENKPYKEGNNDILNIELGYRHHDIYYRFTNELDTSESCMGFYTSYGRFVNRIEGMKIAYNAGQVSKRRAIYSKEDIELYKSINLYNGENEGDFKPLASEDLYCCSPDGNNMNE